MQPSNLSCEQRSGGCQALNETRLEHVTMTPVENDPACHQTKKGYASMILHESGFSNLPNPQIWCVIHAARIWRAC